MRSMVEGAFLIRRTPPPRFARSPSPANAGEDYRKIPVSFRSGAPADL
jgi:hypothetical protein